MISEQREENYLTQYLQSSTYLLMSTNHRIQLVFLGQLCQIDTVLLESFTLFPIIRTTLIVENVPQVHPPTTTVWWWIGR